MGIEIAFKSTLPYEANELIRVMRHSYRFSEQRWQPVRNVGEKCLISDEEGVIKVNCRAYLPRYVIQISHCIIRWTLNSKPADEILLVKVQKPAIFVAISQIIT